MTPMATTTKRPSATTSGQAPRDSAAGLARAGRAEAVERWDVDGLPVAGRAPDLGAPDLAGADWVAAALASPSSSTS